MTSHFLKILFASIYFLVFNINQVSAQQPKKLCSIASKSIRSSVMRFQITGFSDIQSIKKVVNLDLSFLLKKKYDFLNKHILQYRSFSLSPQKDFLLLEIDKCSNHYLIGIYNTKSKYIYTSCILSVDKPLANLKLKKYKVCQEVYTILFQFSYGKITSKSCQITIEDNQVDIIFDDTFTEY